MGYSEGDVILLSDFIEAGAKINNLDTDIENFEKKFNNTIVSIDDVVGNAPGEYEYIG